MRGENLRGRRQEGAGRKRGTPNKRTAALKDAILGALEDAGGQGYLSQVAVTNPAAFLSLLAKLLPLCVGGEPAAEPIRIERVIVDRSLPPEEAYARMLGKD
jgi:hypothetical protein